MKAAFNFNDKKEWQNVNLPHTWNAEDSHDREIYYYRGEGWYRKSLKLTESMLTQNLYLHFEAANQVAEVFINGKFVGQHEAGYTAFRFKINEYINSDNLENNLIVVRVDNSHSPSISPQIGDWTFFGGIYRDVYLIGTNEIHFDMDDYAADGIYLTTPEVNHEYALLNIEGRIRNASDQARRVRLLTEIYNTEGKYVSSETSEFDLKPKTSKTH